LERHRPGDTVKVRVLREGRTVDLEVELEAPP
jgi:S1-C subfamily serine protease